MTAEIAILNKTAVALATDSAVTVSSGSTRHKMFDSGDKLFELCDLDPIGVMINNTMDFAGIPIPTLIRKFRLKGRRFHSVADAAEAFLAFLAEEGSRAPEPICDDYLEDVVARASTSLISRVDDAKKKKLDTLIKSNELANATGPEVVALLEKLAQEAWSEQIALFERLLRNVKHASFVGQQSAISYSRSNKKKVVSEAKKHAIDPSHIDRFCKNIVFPLLLSDEASGNHTGVVVAGFGSEELFPTLVSYRIEGMVFDRLKYVPEEHIDIDRRGRRAAVLPFAQREMVDRFIYGFDGGMQFDIANFCRENLIQFRDEIRGMLDLGGAQQEQEFELLWDGLQGQFLNQLREGAFEAARKSTRDAVETMVEFMPKPELARMAQALIELTSLKRRVELGMETVAGPIDVAVISQSEGFVWVKRKHYFPSDLNGRYAMRLRRQFHGAATTGEDLDA